MDSNSSSSLQVYQDFSLPNSRVFLRVLSIIRYLSFYRLAKFSTHSTLDNIHCTPVQYTETLGKHYTAGISLFMDTVFLTLFDFSKYFETLSPFCWLSYEVEVFFQGARPGWVCMCQKVSVCLFLRIVFWLENGDYWCFNLLLVL